jgi:hypothetical protein
MESCELCGEEERLKDAVADGQLLRLCQRCIIANSAILIEPPSKQQIAESMLPRRKPSEPKIFPAKKEVTLEDLRRIQKEKQAAEAELSQLGLTNEARREPWRGKGIEIDFRSKNLTIADLKIKKERAEAEELLEETESAADTEGKD